jgi:hypothetical protein
LKIAGRQKSWQVLRQHRRFDGAESTDFLHTFVSSLLSIFHNNNRKMTIMMSVKLQLGPFATRSLRAFSSSNRVSSPQAVVELREYALFPEHASTFMKEANASSELRKKISPLRFFTQPDTGGQLHVATHAYYYAGGLSERDAVRKSMTVSNEWQAFTGTTRKYVQSQKSTLFVEAPLVREANLPGLATVLDSQPGDNSILEIRRYNLKLGYDTVPKFLELYGSGLPSKLNADGTDPTTTLVTLLCSEVGRLNEVIEVWRHGNGVAAMEQSRGAARQAKEWRSAIANIADLAIEFSATIHRPLPFSPIK